MSGFASLKKQRGNFADLSKKLADDKKGGGGNKKDDRYWTLTTDEAGNGYAVIRFLPAPPDRNNKDESEEMPYVKIYNHAFQDKKTSKWYIENSRTTLGEPDPVAEANSELWNTGIESNKEIARQRKRQLKYISNILVISDPKAPENEGKVFLFKYGAKIFGLIENAIDPKFPDEPPFNPYDFWGGANFKLKAHVVEKQRSYDRSGFDKPEALFNGDDTALEKLWNSEYSLLAEIAPDKFKSYDQLKTRFQATIGQAAPRPAQAQADEVQEQFTPRKPEPAATRAPAAPAAEDDDDIAKYAGLLKDFGDDDIPF